MSNIISERAMKAAYDEIESLRKSLENMTEIARKEYLSAIDWAGKHQVSSYELSASQAREQQLREMLKKSGMMVDAFFPPGDTTSLEAMITKAGEVMRNRMVASGFSQPHEEYFGCIIQLTIKSLPPITLKDLE